MKKILLVLVLLLNTFAAHAAEKVVAKVGKIKAKINTDKENNTVSLSLAGDKLTVGFGYSKTVINGLNTKSTTISSTIQFAIEGDLEAGRTYEFNSTSIAPIVTAVKTNVKNTLGYSTTGDLSESSSASGSLKVTSYDSTTGEIKALFKAKVAPVQIQKGTKVSELSKGVAIKAVIDAIVD